MEATLADALLPVQPEIRIGGEVLHVPQQKQDSPHSFAQRLE